MSNIYGFIPDNGFGFKKVLEGYVTIDTSQIITGEKVFNSDLVCTQDITTENVIFGDGTAQSTAYKSLIPGNYTNTSIVVDVFGAIISVASGTGGNLVTTDTVQTITAEKTFSSTILNVGNRITYKNAGADCYLETTTAAQSINIQAGSGGGLIKILSVPRFTFGSLTSYGGILTVNTTASITFPFKNLYLVALGSSSNFLTVPNASPELEGTDITFRKVSGTGNMAVRQENGALNIVGPAGIEVYTSIVCMSTTDSWSRIICVNSVWYAMR